MLIRALVAFVALPGLVAFVVPLALAWARVREGAFDGLALVPLLAGAALLIWCVRDFLVRGHGTLAPWDPPTRLVSSGPYRVSRNPMYVAVGLVLAGWALAFHSWGLLLYALLVMAAFHLRVVLNEEPRLARTFERDWVRYAASVPRWLFPSRRALLLGWLGLAALSLVGGLGYEAYSEALAARDYPAPGTLVDIGGRHLHLLCIGQGTPTVLFESSGWGGSLSSPLVREAVSARATVCSYDRRGRGWSDSASGVTTTAALVNDLAVLQDRAHVAWPLVIVASSIGGLTAELFARTYPERVGGLVFVDAASSTIRQDAISSRMLAATALACVSGGLAQFGLIRLLDPFNIETDTEDGRRAAALTYSGRAWAETCAMVRGLRSAAAELAAAPRLPPDLPLVVLSASSTTDLLPPLASRVLDVERLRTELTDSHKRLALRSSRGLWRLVPDSTHLIGESQPDAVVKAVSDVLVYFFARDRT